MKKELTKKQQETLAKKEKIYKVAVSLFKEYGYEDTSIRDICKNADVTTGTLYNLYENKADILNTFKEKLTEQSNLPLQNNHINIDNPLDTITNYIMAVLSAFHELGAEMTLNLHSQRGHIWDDKSEGTLLLEKFILSCQKEKTMIDGLSAEELADDINTIIYGLIYQWCDQRGNYDLITKANKSLPLLLSPFIALT